jgi:hypothetical protein
VGYSKRQRPKKLGRGSLVRVAEGITNQLLGASYPSDRGVVVGEDSDTPVVEFHAPGVDPKVLGQQAVPRAYLTRTTARELAVLDVMES